MESDPHPAAALAAVEAARKLNAERLRRPKRYWTMLGLMLAVFALMPYLSELPPLLQYSFPLLALLGILIFSAWRQPPAARKVRLSGSMALTLIAFALGAGIIGGLSRALYETQGWLWVPASAALLLFVFVTFGGRALDRSWARRASRGAN